MEMKRVAQKKLEGPAQWKGFGVWTRMKGAVKGAAPNWRFSA